MHLEPLFLESNGTHDVASYIHQSLSSGQAFGVVASLTQLFTWAPQIAHTLRTRDLGSLSVAQLCIQFPGRGYAQDVLQHICQLSFLELNAIRLTM